MQLTDGQKVVELTKEEMEIILDGIRELKYHYGSFSQNRARVDGEFDNLLEKFEGLEY